MRQSVRDLWEKRQIVRTLAERDLRATYKEAGLGFLWAILVPLAYLAILTIIFSRVKPFKVPGVPYILYVYTGLICWQFFTNSLGRGSSSILGNKQLLNKVYFPRECFPISVIVGQIVNSSAAILPLGVLMAIKGFPPKAEGLWVPVFLAIELVFATGVIMGVAALIMNVRDLLQVIPVVTTFGMFFSPVIWPFKNIPSSIHLGHAVHHHYPFTIPFVKQVYSFINPMGPVLDNVKRTLLLGQSPAWPYVLIAAISACGYLFVGYRVFKRLEVDFADIA
jgi:lipopolysaccharide transport system permease protein